MVDITRILCPCGTHPIFGYEGDVRASACVLCKTDGMVNITRAKCSSTECERQGLIKDGDENYCITCAGARGLVTVSQNNCSAQASNFLDAVERDVFGGARIPYRDRLLSDQSWERKEKYGLLKENRRLHPDGYIPPPDESPSDFRGTIVEYHGEFYHGFPPWHTAHESFVFNGQWGPDLYESTMQRMQLFKDAGFRVLYIWGCDWALVNKGRMKLAEALREL